MTEETKVSSDFSLYFRKNFSKFLFQFGVASIQHPRVWLDSSGGHMTPNIHSVDDFFDFDLKIIV